MFSGRHEGVYDSRFLLQLVLFPFSYWSPGESNRTSSSTSTYFSIAARIRVKIYKCDAINEAEITKSGVSGGGGGLF